jgi:NADH-quinone oxidoreductase subunit A
MMVMFVICLLSILLIPQRQEPEKLSPYECGFNPYGDARNKFEMRFYVIGILFLIFDLEIVFLFPLAIVGTSTGTLGHIPALSFIIIIAVGFAYEWARGALDWE